MSKSKKTSSKKNGKKSTKKAKTYSTKKAAKAAEKKKDTAGKSSWTKTKTAAQNQQGTAKNPSEYKPSGLSLAQDGSTTDVRASWTFPKAKASHIASFEADWEISQTGAAGSWKSQGVDSVDTDSSASGTYQATQSIASDWKYVRVRVRAKAEQHTVTGTVVDYKATKTSKGKYKLTSSKEKKSAEYYWFGGTDGYGSWTAYATCVNPAWQSTATETEKTETENRTGTPDAVGALDVEYSDGQDLGHWHITWEYPTDEHIIASTTLLESTDGGSTWQIIGQWADKATTSYYRPEIPGTKVMFKIRLETDGGSAETVSGVNVARPVAPEITSVEAGENSVTVHFETSGVAGDTAEIYYSQDYEDVLNPSSSSTVQTASFSYTCYPQESSYKIANFDASGTWYFSMRLKSDSGYSDVSDTESVLVGTTADAPTPTFQSGGTVEQGKTVRLSWIHNDADNSQQTKCRLMVTRSDTGSTQTIDVDGANGYYDYDTTGIASGTEVAWGVCTAGANGVLGEYCESQTFDVYARPNLSVTLTDGAGKAVSGTLSTLPLTIDASSGDTSQDVVEWTVTATLAESCTITDVYGDEMPLSAGTEVFRERIVEGDDEYGSETMQMEITALDADWPSAASVSLEISALMSCGLLANPATVVFGTDFASSADVAVSAMVTPGSAWTAEIRPEARDADGNLSTGHTLAVYRIDDDGYTEIASGIANDQPVLIDDYPNFGRCTYRIVANDTATDQMTSTDAYVEIDEASILIQWGEPSIYAENGTVEAISANYLQLPYNIKISEKRAKDVALKQYIGREHEVAYYGTIITQSGSWQADISVADDGFALDQLRALGSYMGDVYVREPTGTGYWATVDVDGIDSAYNSALQNVSLSVTRVENG